MVMGYTGKLLFVDLASRDVQIETPDEGFYRDYMGGYGLGVRILYDRQRGGVDALGPENVFGVIGGALNGMSAPMSSRWTVVCKSPLTGTWGDANSGGDFGPYMRYAGFDGIFFRGIPDQPVYLLVNDSHAELRDATGLWGKDSVETEDILKGEHGRDARLLCIGQGGEKLSLISGVVTNKGRLAARSGVGAVMGSKKLKAVVVKGKKDIPIADKDKMLQVRRDMLEALHGPMEDRYKKYGTAGLLAGHTTSGRTPTKNWGGIGPVDFPQMKKVSDDAVIKYEVKKFACWGCPWACGGHVMVPDGPYAVAGHKPEYETLATFGTMCLNDNVESIIKCNDICNRYGLDTISVGCTLAFAVECYENGIITKEDTDGMELTWGNHQALVAMTEMIARREGFGQVLADGVSKAYERLGRGSAKEFAVHIGGQELGMHDPKQSGGLDRYLLDATPGRHTQGGGARSFRQHVINMVGFCYFGNLAVDMPQFVPRFLAASTGWERSWEEIQMVGERVANLRQVFTLREGLNPATREVPGRVYGNPPLQVGPTAGATVDVEKEVREWHLARDWDPATGKPSRQKLLQLNLGELARELWPD
ncbi:MAG: aldehyde ferredoxin oxidoreductase family protein [Chloroflexi bacterium]|nr:aldehyde ferredoxin oxidoreductase family protein [Chloroflexota bacterium]